MIGERTQRNFGEEDNKKGKLLYLALLAYNACIMLVNVNSIIMEALEIHLTKA